MVIIVSSIPLIRPMFRRSSSRTQATELQKWDTSTISSVFSKRNTRTNLSRVESEENIIERQDTTEAARPEQHGEIQVTHEVSVSYEPSNVPYVHAALVGLIQGEIANPHLARH